MKELSRLSKDEWREYTKSVWQVANVTDPRHPAVFPEEIPLRLVKLFSFVGDTVLDPFAGIGTTVAAALKLGRSAIAVDQNPAYVDAAREIGIGSASCAAPSVEARVGDCRDLSWIATGSVGLVVTSPPYWNKADYGDGPANLGNVSGYADFLCELRGAFRECLRVLAPGRKLCVVTANVNQHTDMGLLSFPLAADMTNLLRDIGFLMVTEIIWNKNGTGGRWGSWGAQRPIFGSYPYPPNFLFKTVHEHILVFAKPPEARTRGPKVRRLEEIMASGNSEGRGGAVLNGNGSRSG